MRNRRLTFQMPSDFNGKDLEDLLDQFPVALREHSRRVAVCSSIMAEYADSFLNPCDMPAKRCLVLTAHIGGTCHDIGKLLLPTVAMNKDDYLQHSSIGAELLYRHKKAFFQNEAQARMVLDMVSYHHERPDGKGFPYGLQSKNIPWTARICALANWLDHRLFPKTEGYDRIDGVFNEIKPQNGKLFFESAVICLERTWPQLVEQYDKWKQPCM